VQGTLALSRAIGDFEFKNKALKPEQQMVSPCPEFIIEKISPNTEYVVIACDGIWDVMSSQETVEFINQARGTKRGKGSVKAIVDDLLDACCANSIDENNGLGTDNMSCIIVELKK
jgi:serine/threonine protein phosphatase PrpC